MKNNRALKPSFVLSAMVLSLFASNAGAVSLVALDSSNRIGVFDSASSSIDTNTFNVISGAAAGEAFIGIDLRPSNNTVYGITTSNKLYTIDAYSGNSSFVANLSSSIVSGNKGYGIDFNPVADRTTGASLRLVSTAGDNYAINAATGAVTTATSIVAGYSGVAYSNSDPSTPTVRPASTTLFYINSGDDTLASTPTGFNNPTIQTIGSLGLNVLSANGFELLADRSAFSAFSYDDGLLKTGLFNINLNTGAATQIGLFNGTVNGLTLAPVSAVPEHDVYAMMLAGLGLVSFVSRRRNKAKTA